MMVQNYSLDVNNLTFEHVIRNRELIFGYPYKPYYYYPALTNEVLTEYTLERQRTLLSQNDVVGLELTEGERALGRVFCGRLQWDSDVLGIEAGFIGPFYVDNTSANAGRVRELLLARSLTWLKQAGVRHVTSRLDVNEIELMHLFEENGFVTVDQILHFNLNLRRGAVMSEDPERSVPGVEWRLHREEDLPHLREIAAHAYKFDRFHSDPQINLVSADAAYERWVENSCRGLADAVVVAAVKGVPVGFMTLKLNSDSKKFLNFSVGKIWLVGVADIMRGRGIARGLMAHSLRWFLEHGADVAEVGTQLRNTAGMRLYAKCGFEPVNPLLALRKML